MAEIKQVSANVQRQGSKSFRTGIRELATCNQSFSPLFTTRRRHYKSRWSLSDRFSKYSKISTPEVENVQQKCTDTDTDTVSYENRDGDNTEDKENEPDLIDSVCATIDIQKCSLPFEEEEEECDVRQVDSSTSIKGIDDDMIISNEQDSGVPITCAEDTTNRLEDTTNRLEDTTNRLEDTTKTLEQIEDLNIDSMRQSYPSTTFTASLPIFDSPPPPPPPPPPPHHPPTPAQPVPKPSSLVSPISPPPPPPPPPPPQYRPQQPQMFSQPPILNNVCYGGSFIPIVNPHSYPMNGIGPTQPNYWQGMSQDAWPVMPRQDNEMNYMCHQTNDSLKPVNTSVQNSDCAGKNENNLDIGSHSQPTCSAVGKLSPAISNSSNSPSLSNPTLIEEHPYAPPIIMRNIMQDKKNETKQRENSPGTPDLLEKCLEKTEEKESISQKMEVDKMYEKQTTKVNIGAKTLKGTESYELFDMDSDGSSGKFEVKSFVEILKKRVRHASGSSVSSRSSTDSQSSKSSSRSDSKSTSKKGCNAKHAKAFHGRTLLKGKEVRARNIPLTPLYKRKPYTSKGKPTERPKDPRDIVKPTSLDQRCSVLLGECQGKKAISLAVPSVSCSDFKPPKCESPHKMLEDILHKAISKDIGVKKLSLISKLQDNRDYGSDKILVQNRVALLSPNVRAGIQLDRDGASDTTNISDLKETLELDRNIQMASEETENITDGTDPILTESEDVVTGESCAESEDVVTGDSCAESETVAHEESPKLTMDQNDESSQESLEQRIQNTVNKVQLRTKAITNLVKTLNKGGKVGSFENDSSDFKDSDSDILVIDITGYSDYEVPLARDQMPVSELERTVEIRAADSNEIGVRFDDGDKFVDFKRSPEKMYGSDTDKTLLQFTSPEKSNHSDEVMNDRILEKLDVTGKKYERMNSVMQEAEKVSSLEEGEMIDSEESSKELPRKHRHRHRRHHRSRHRRRRSPQHRHTGSLHDIGQGSPKHHGSSSRHHHHHSRSRSSHRPRRSRSRSPVVLRSVIDLTSEIHESGSSDEDSRSRSTSITRTRSRSRSDSRSRAGETSYQPGLDEQINKRNVWERLGLIMDGLSTDRQESNH